jgi:hypothetical protein
MKKTLAIASWLVCAAAIAAPEKLPFNSEQDAKRTADLQAKADADWQASTNAMSDADFIAAVDSAQNLKELKDAIKRNAASDKDRADRAKKAKEPKELKGKR